MDRLTFTVGVLNALAWPCAAVVIAALLRKPLSDLIGRMRHARWGDFEFDFDRELKVAESLAAEFPQPAEPSRESNLRQIVSLDPAAAVAAAWSDVEAALDTVIAEEQPQGSAGQTLEPERHRVLKTRIIMARGLLSETDLRVFAQLRNLRNLAVHGTRQITKEEAEEYLALASRFVAKLETLTKAKGGKVRG